MRVARQLTTIACIALTRASYWVENDFVCRLKVHMNLNGTQRLYSLME